MSLKNEGRAQGTYASLICNTSSWDPGIWDGEA